MNLPASLSSAPYRSLILLLLTLLLIEGCAPLLVAGAAGGATLIGERRSSGRIFDDQAVELKVAAAIGEDPILSVSSRVTVTCYNGRLLLTGDVLTEEHAAAVVKLAQPEQAMIRRVDNELQVGPLNSSDSAQDAWITTKVKSQLYGDPDISGNRVKVVTEHGVVYLMGLVTRVEANLATVITSNVTNVKRVVRLFEYLD